MFDIIMNFDISNMLRSQSSSIICQHMKKKIQSMETTPNP